MTKDADSGEKQIKRNNTHRNDKEFGGNLGCLITIIFLPLKVYYFYGCLMLNNGKIAMPSVQFVKDLLFKLPPGLSIIPRYDVLIVLCIWIVFQAVLEICIPGQTFEGTPNKTGKKLKYTLNGLTAFFISQTTLIFLYFCGILKSTYVFENMGSLITWGIIIAWAVSIWLYIDFGVFWKRHVNDPEFEDDWGVFSYKNFFNDFFMGLSRNPRILHFLKIPFDVKRFWNARPGLTLWVMANFSLMSAQYFNCKVDSESVTCQSQGNISNITIPMWFVCLNQWYYIFDYNWNETAYLTTTDIRHDMFGYMLVFGSFGFLPWFYTFSFSYYLAIQTVPLNYNTYCSTIGITLGIIGMILFRQTNSQKDKFRTYYYQHGNMNNYKIWGQPVKFIKSEEGSLLLYSGYWGLARHFNYIGDMLMCLGWLIACCGAYHSFPFVPLGYVLYFYGMDIHRSQRDEERCMKKYKKDWEQYKKLVPYRIIPGII